jgi:Pyridine nucleotide-disulphide oxidoreductase
MMDVDFLLHHLIIVHGGYIGLEFGQIYRRFGSEVTIIKMARRLVLREDEDVSEAIKDIIELEGARIIAVLPAVRGSGMNGNSTSPSHRYNRIRNRDGPIPHGIRHGTRRAPRPGRSERCGAESGGDESDKKEYVDVERFTGPGDMGRDVVGYLTKTRHEGP